MTLGGEWFPRPLALRGVLSAEPMGEVRDGPVFLQPTWEESGEALLIKPAQKGGASPSTGSSG